MDWWINDNTTKKYTRILEIKHRVINHGIDCIFWWDARFLKPFLSSHKINSHLTKFQNWIVINHKHNRKWYYFQSILKSNVFQGYLKSSEKLHGTHQIHKSMWLTDINYRTFICYSICSKWWTSYQSVDYQRQYSNAICNSLWKLANVQRKISTFLMWMT